MKARFTVLKCTFAAWLLCAPCVARGDVLVDFNTDPDGNALGNGEVLTNQYAAWGVSFTALEDGQTVASTVWNDIPSRGNIWLNTGEVLGAGAWDVLRIEFAFPVMDVQWLTYSLGASSVTFRAYDADDNLLETVAKSGDDAPTEFSVSGISRIDGEQATDDWFWGMDNLSYTPVPEPSAAALWLLLGMFGVGYGWCRGRRH